MDILAALTALAPSIVAALTIWFAYRQNRENQQQQLKQLQAQWEHEEKKAQIESDAAKAKHQRESLQEVYANAIRSLSEVLIIANQQL